MGFELRVQCLSFGFRVLALVIRVCRLVLANVVDKKSNQHSAATAWCIGFRGLGLRQLVFKDLMAFMVRSGRHIAVEVVHL